MRKRSGPAARPHGDVQLGGGAIRRAVALLLRDRPTALERWPSGDLVITDGQSITVGDTSLKVYVTPGHTPGSQCFLVGDRHHRPSFLDVVVLALLAVDDAAALRGEEVLLAPVRDVLADALFTHPVVDRCVDEIDPGIECPGKDLQGSIFI